MLNERFPVRPVFTKRIISSRGREGERSQDSRAGLLASLSQGDSCTSAVPTHAGGGALPPEPRHGLPGRQNRPPHAIQHDRSHCRSVLYPLHESDAFPCLVLWQAVGRVPQRSLVVRAHLCYAPRWWRPGWPLSAGHQSQPGCSFVDWQGCRLSAGTALNHSGEATGTIALSAE